MSPRTLLLAALLAFALAGCGERAEPVAPGLPLYPVTVRGAGDHAIVLERRPRRIVALDPGPTELIAKLGAAERLVGVAAGVKPPAFYTGELAGASIVASATGRVEVEAVVAAEPDLVVATSETDAADLGAIAARTEAAVYVQPSRSLGDLERATIELGLLVGAPVRARQLVTSLRAEVAGVRARIAGREPVRVFVDTGFFVSVPQRSLVADLVRAAGGESVARGQSAEPFAPCHVVRLRPDIVLRLLDEHQPPSRLARRLARCPRTGPLPRVAVLRLADFTAGPAARAGLRSVVRALHPDAFR